MVNFVVAVDTREKRMTFWEAKTIQYRITDKFEEFNPCLVTEPTHIYDFVFASRADQKCFIYS